MSKKLYEALNTPYLKRVINDIKEASEKLNIDFFCVGALARNIWYVEHEEPSRGTKDVDFGVNVPSDFIYNKLKAILISDYHYVETDENAFCLISPYESVPVDLLPFGEIEEQGKVIIEGKGLVSMNLEGFSEVHQKGLIEAKLEGDQIKICTIPSVVLLKLIAYDDRPEHRQKDPLDINSILFHYPHLETNLIWDEYHFLFDGNRSHEEIGIIVLGIEVSKLINGNKKLEERILDILEKGIQLKSQLPEHMIQLKTTENYSS